MLTTQTSSRYLLFGERLHPHPLSEATRRDVRPLLALIVADLHLIFSYLSPTSPPVISNIN